jgi:hypothetical protein
VFTQYYFLSASSLNNPVISASLLGSLALLYLHEGLHVKFFLCLLSSLLIRESALVFALAAPLVRLDKKTGYYIFLAVLSLGFAYFWHYFRYDQTLINPQMRSLKQGTGKIFEFNLSRWGDYFYTVISSFSLSFIILSIIGFVFSIIHFREYKFKLLLAFLLVFFLHLSFFAFYPDRAARNTFMSAQSIVVVLGLLFMSAKIHKFIKWGLLACVFIFSLFYQKKNNV